MGVASIPALAHSLAPLLVCLFFVVARACRICRKQLYEAGSELVSLGVLCFTRSINCISITTTMSKGLVSDWWPIATLSLRLVAERRQT